MDRGGLVDIQEAALDQIAERIDAGGDRFHCEHCTHGGFPPASAESLTAAVRIMA